jgi:hypothetical protein
MSRDAFCGGRAPAIRLFLRFRAWKQGAHQIVISALQSYYFQSVVGASLENLSGLRGMARIHGPERSEVFSMYIVNCRMQQSSGFSPISVSTTSRRRPYLLLLLLGLSLSCVAPSIRATSLAAAASGNTSAWALAQSNPVELMRQVAQNELANTYGRRAPLRYRVRKLNAKSDSTKEIVETSDGGVARLIAIGGRPLSVEQEQQEVERLHALDADPAIEAHRRRNELRDAERIVKFTRLLPNAFTYQSTGPVGTTGDAMIRLTFTPNPKFTPPDFESRILTGIRGEVWIDPQDRRVVRIQGRIFRTVDFGWGIIGSLYPGATIQIEQSKTSACGWQMTHLGLHLEGKELMFKSLHIVVEETAGNYQPVPPEWSYKDAIRWLLQIPTVQSTEINKS